MANQSSILYKLFRKITGKHRYSYEINSILYKYSDLEFYKEFCFAEENYIPVENLNPIISNIEFHTTTRQLKATFGKPALIVDITSKIKIFLYKFVKNGEKQKLLFHYFNDKLILMSRLLSFVDDQKVLSLQNMHLQEYNLPSLSTFEDKIYLQDTKNQSLYLVKNLEYIEHFIKYDEGFQNYIASKLT
jgi:hypothetical protein